MGIAPDLVKQVTPPVVSALLRLLLPAGLGALFALLVIGSMRRSTAFALDHGRAPGIAVAYAAFMARLLATAMFFVAVIMLSPHEGPAAAAGFIVVVIAAPAVSLVRFAYPRRMRHKGGIH